jgi:fatty-acid desaturase
MPKGLGAIFAPWHKCNLRICGIEGRARNIMKIYNIIGYGILLAYAAGCLALAPAALGPWNGLLIGGFYLAVFWFLAGVYLADVLHLGIAHRALNFKPWFIHAVTLVNNLFGVYVGPTAWVNRHRLHHKYSDHEGDPNKLHDDGFWSTLRLCLFPYKCNEDMARDDILQSWVFRLCESLPFIIFSQVFNFVLLALLVGDWAFAAFLWLGLRAFAVWVNMIQNYWTHTRDYGTRRYADEHDNAMNIGEWLPVTATFSACLQNNHHHYPNMLRLSHADDEYDFGFMTIKWMKALGLVEATRLGAYVPADVPIKNLGF